MGSAEITLHGFVYGRVQGVFFRARTRDKAMELDLSGWVRNVADGSVEVLICGSKRATDAMGQWLATGPPLARVDSVQLSLIEFCDVTGFHIKP